MSGNPLSELSTEQLVHARLQLHHAAQIPAILARSYIGSHPEDIHANLGWDTQHKALMTYPISSSDNTLQIGIQLETLSIIMVNKQVVHAFPLAGNTWDQGLHACMEFLQRNGLTGEKLRLEQPYQDDLPDFPSIGKKSFDFNDKRSFQVLSDLFSHADALITKILSEVEEASEIRCWPHHFDIAGLISYEGEKSVGIGLSPGDASSTLPYYYINMWPYPDKSTTSLPELKAGGKWHTEGWTGAILIADEIWKADKQSEKTENFIREAFSHAQALIK